MNRLRQVLLKGENDLRRLARDPLALVLFIFLPVFLGFLINLAFGGQDGSSTPKARLLVADRDGSLVGGLLTGALGQDALSDLLITETVEYEEGRRRMERGDASALLTIPEGFGDRYLAGEPDTLDLLTNPAQTILPGIAREVLEILATAGGVLREYLDGPIDRIQQATEGGQGPSDASVADIAVEVNGLVERIEGYLFPAAITYTRVEEDTAAAAAEEDVGPTLIGLFFPGLLTMVLLFVCQELAEDIWNERRSGALRRVLSGPQGAGWFVAGKLAASGTVVVLLMLLGGAVGAWFLGLDLRYWALGGLFMGLVGIAFAALLMGAYASTENERGAAVLVSLLIMILLLGGGSFFPLEAMPSWLASIGRFTPNGWAITRFNDLTRGEAGPGILLLPALGLVLLTLAGWWYTTHRVRGDWGRGTG